MSRPRQVALGALIALIGAAVVVLAFTLWTAMLQREADRLDPRLPTGLTADGQIQGLACPPGQIQWWRHGVPECAPLPTVEIQAPAPAPTSMAADNRWVTATTTEPAWEKDWTAMVEAMNRLERALGCGRTWQVGDAVTAQDFDRLARCAEGVRVDAVREERARRARELVELPAVPRPGYGGTDDWPVPLPFQVDPVPDEECTPVAGGGFVCTRKAPYDPHHPRTSERCPDGRCLEGR